MRFSEVRRGYRGYRGYREYRECRIGNDAIILNEVKNLRDAMEVGGKYE